jgi:hypothetical protein
VTVGIQSDSEHNRRLFGFGLVGHELRLACRRTASKRKNRRLFFLCLLEQKQITLLSVWKGHV